MRSITEIKEAQETIKMQLTQVETELGRINLQGQYAALDWVITEEAKKEESE
jgi:phosphate-selective porin